VEIPDEHVESIVRALQHYADYLRATNRDCTPYRAIAAQLMRKEPGSETGKKSAAKRKA
jgi:hypothetical protein